MTMTDELVKRIDTAVEKRELLSWLDLMEMSEELTRLTAALAEAEFELKAKSFECEYADAEIGLLQANLAKAEAERDAAREANETVNRLLNNWMQMHRDSEAERDAVLSVTAQPDLVIEAQFQKLRGDALERKLAASEAERERFAAHVTELLEREAVWSKVRGASDCCCMFYSRDTEREYETGTCPHQRVRAALATPAPAKTGETALCTFGPEKERKRVFILKFEDADVGDMYFTDEAEAVKAFGRHSFTWNCTLLSTHSPTPPADRDAVLEPVCPTCGEIEQPYCSNPWHSRARPSRDAVLEEAAKTAESDPELPGTMPEELYLVPLEDALRAAVRATKKSVASRVRALKSQPGEG
jgi:hypothetical protein